MPRIATTTFVPVDVATAFAVSQMHGPERVEWDPFIHSQHLINADAPAKGVQTATVSRHRLKMVTEYVSFRAPTQVGMKMVEGPWFFSTFGSGWAFKEIDGGTEATWRYTFAVQPKWLSPIADPIGRWLLGRDIRARIGAFAAACENPAVIAALPSA